MKEHNNVLTKLYACLTPRERRDFWLLMVLVLLMAFVQTLGVGAVAPFMAVASNPNVVVEQPQLAWAYEVGGFESVQSFLMALGAGVIAILLLGNAFTVFTMYWLYRYVDMRGASLSHRLFRQYLYQPYSYFLNKNSSELSRNILSEVQQAVNGLMRPLVELIAKGVVAVVLVILLLVTDPLVALAVFGVMGGGYAVITVVFSPVLRRLGLKRRKWNLERFSASGEAFGAIKDIKIRGTEETFDERFENAAQHYSWTQAKHHILSSTPKYAMEGVFFSLGIGLVVALTALRGGFASAVPLLAVYAYAAQRLNPALERLYRGVAKLKFAGPAVEGLYEDLILGGDRFREQRAVRKEGASRQLLFEREIALKDVSFSYEGGNGTPVLTNINLGIPKNTTVGLVGPTGCGKSTLVDIILGLLPARSGELQVDGRTLSEAEISAWRQRFGYVPQEIYLSDRTIRENIAFGIPRNAVRNDQVEHAARVANVHEFIANELSEGYNTRVGERGVRLSGGQRQRIGIARALYHNPDILVMDEATSALDSVTEAAVMDAMHTLMHTKTIILIAHRITTVQECDSICLMEAGRIVAKDGYEVLVRDNESFRAMAKVEED